MSETPPANRPAPALVLLLILPLLGMGIAVLMVLNESRPTDLNIFAAELQPQAAALLNFIAPDFELTDLDGKQVQLSDYRGRVLFLNFWQTTCIPCVKELPAFAEFAAATTEASVLAINFEESPQQIRDFFTLNEIMPVPVVLDTDSLVRRSYGVINIPTTFIIDSEGIVRDMHLGALDVDLMWAYLEQVQTP